MSYSLMVKMCKMIISQGCFLFFQNSDYLGYFSGKRAKNGPKC